jgi:hypothetical protein
MRRVFLYLAAHFAGSGRRVAPGEGWLRTHGALSLRKQPPTLSAQPRGEGDDQTDAVVTPPSTTMVWPVMKVEASEAR